MHKIKQWKNRAMHIPPGVSTGSQDGGGSSSPTLGTGGIIYKNTRHKLVNLIITELKDEQRNIKDINMIKDIS